MDRVRISLMRRWFFHLAFVLVGLCAAVTAGCFGGAPVATTPAGPAVPTPPAPGAVLAIDVRRGPVDLRADQL